MPLLLNTLFLFLVRVQRYALFLKQTRKKGKNCYIGTTTSSFLGILEYLQLDATQLQVFLCNFAPELNNGLYGLNGYMKLSELKTGEKGIIVKVLGHGGFRKRLIEMGFIKGQEVEVLLNAPLQDPVKYKLMGYEVSLRHQEAEYIEVVTMQISNEE